MPRPRTPIDWPLVDEMRRRGRSWRQVARHVGVARSTLHEMASRSGLFGADAVRHYRFVSHGRAAP